MVIIIGGIFFYVDVILFGIDENIETFATVDRLCQVYRPLSIQKRHELPFAPFYEGSDLGSFHRILPVLWPHAGQSFQGLLHFPKCQAEEEGEK